MPCYRFRFNDPPLYYFGHVLPPPIVQIVLHYAYEMTIWEDMCTLHDRLESTLSFLHQFKIDLTAHLAAYRILGESNSVPEQISKDTRALCHRASVDLSTCLNPKTRTRLPRRRALWVTLPARPEDPHRSASSCLKCPTMFKGRLKVFLDNPFYILLFKRYRYI